MRIAITGANGQLGRALAGRLTAGNHLIALARSELDVADFDATVTTLEAFDPDVVINAAAHTNVDACEADPQAAFRANAMGARNVAIAAARCHARVVHVSTNYVFDGEQDQPYHEWSSTNPLSVYGASKLAGEQAVRDHAGGQFYIVRTAWLYAENGRNFVRTMLRLADEQPTLRVVGDQFGQPTYAGDLASAIGQLIQQPAFGTYHLTNAGVCSWFDWAAETMRQSGHASKPMERIPATDFPRPARPPVFGALANWNGSALGISLRPWQDALGDCLRAIARG